MVRPQPYSPTSAPLERVIALLMLLEGKQSWLKGTLAGAGAVRNKLTERKQKSAGLCSSSGKIEMCCITANFKSMAQEHVQM